MTEHLIEVRAVLLVAGRAFNCGWNRSMTLIRDVNGEEFIDYGHNFLKWEAVAGSVVPVAVQTCKRRPDLLWAHV